VGTEIRANLSPMSSHFGAIFISTLTGQLVDKLTRQLAKLENEIAILSIILIYQNVCDCVVAIFLSSFCHCSTETKKHN